MTTAVTVGNILSVGSTAGALDSATDVGADHQVVALALETNAVSSTLTKVLVV